MTTSRLKEEPKTPARHIVWYYSTSHFCYLPAKVTKIENTEEDTADDLQVTASEEPRFKLEFFGTRESKLVDEYELGGMKVFREQNEEDILSFSRRVNLSSKKVFEEAVMKASEMALEGTVESLTTPSVGAGSSTSGFNQKNKSTPNTPIRPPTVGAKRILFSETTDNRRNFAMPTTSKKLRGGQTTLRNGSFNSVQVLTSVDLGKSELDEIREAERKNSEKLALLLQGEELERQEEQEISALSFGSNQLNEACSQDLEPMPEIILQDKRIPLGTPVFVKKGSVYMPARIVKINDNDTYNLKIFTKSIMKSVTRDLIVQTSDESFPRVPLHQDFLSYEVKSTKKRDIEKFLIEYTGELLEVVRGERESRRRDMFFGSIRERHELQEQVRAGPLTSAEYYDLIDTMIFKWLPVHTHEMTALSQRVGIKASHRFKDEAVALLQRQFVSDVLVAELIILILINYGPDLNGSNKMTLEDADAWITSGGDGDKANEDDCLTYLMSRREMLRWAMNLK